MRPTPFVFLCVLAGAGLAVPLTPARPGGDQGDGRGSVTVVRVPDPLAAENPRYLLIPIPVPAPGKPFADARFGTRLMRVTQEGGARHEYSRHDPFNKDQSLILLRHPDRFGIYRTRSVPYDSRANFVREVDVEEPRWDRDAPDRLWGLQGFRIVTVEASTGRSVVVKDFARDPKVGPVLKAEPDLYRVTTRDEGEASLDGRYWAFLLQGSKEDYRARYLLCWDRRQDRVLGLHRLRKEESRIDWVGMSPLGTWVLVGADWDNGGRLAGLVMADRELTRFHRLDYATAHADVGLDADGREVVVMQNNRTDYIDLIPLDFRTKPILEGGGSYKGTNRTPLIRLFYSSGSPASLQSGVHISCNCPGYCVVSTVTGPGLKEQNWLDRTITLVRLDPRRPKVFYLAKVHNTTKEYWEETHAAITNDGSRVVWASNGGQDVGKSRAFLMRLDMPKNWKQLAR